MGLPPSAFSGSRIILEAGTITGSLLLAGKEEEGVAICSFKLAITDDCCSVILDCFSINPIISLDFLLFPFYTSCAS